jgi:hypothetical protein
MYWYRLQIKWDYKKYYLGIVLLVISIWSLIFILTLNFGELKPVVISSNIRNVINAFIDLRFYLFLKYLCYRFRPLCCSTLDAERWTLSQLRHEPGTSRPQFRTFMNQAKFRRISRSGNIVIQICGYFWVNLFAELSNLRKHFLP